MCLSLFVTWQRGFSSMRNEQSFPVNVWSAIHHHHLSLVSFLYWLSSFVFFVFHLLSSSHYCPPGLDCLCVPQRQNGRTPSQTTPRPLKAWPVVAAFSVCPATLSSSSPPSASSLYPNKTGSLLPGATRVSMLSAVDVSAVMGLSFFFCTLPLSLSQDYVR